MPIVDVRNVAEAHVMAALDPMFQNRNDRFLLSAGSIWYKEIIKFLRENHDKSIKSREIGYFTLKFGQLINPNLKKLIPFLNKEIRIEGQNDLNL